MTCSEVNRRGFMGLFAAAAAAPTAFAGQVKTGSGGRVAPPLSPAPPRRFHLGMVTYNMGKNMSVEQLIELCKKTGLEGVELRTTHAHGVEPTLPGEKRREVKKRFEDSGVILWGLGTTCEFHSPDPAEVRRQIAICADFCKLAEDVGARGVKVRPNGLPRGVPVEKTLEQIGKALAECGRIAADHGVEIWLEVHGRGTSHPPHIRTIMDHCRHPRVGVCWNCNPSDMKNGSVHEYFLLLRKNLMSCHMRDLYDRNYPYRELFALMRQTNYDRFTLAEIAGSSDPVRVMRYYRALWELLSS